MHTQHKALSRCSPLTRQIRQRCLSKIHGPIQDAQYRPAGPVDAFTVLAQRNVERVLEILTHQLDTTEKTGEKNLSDLAAASAAENRSRVSDYAAGLDDLLSVARDTDAGKSLSRPPRNVPRSSTSVRQNLHRSYNSRPSTHPGPWSSSSRRSYATEAISPVSATAYPGYPEFLGHDIVKHLRHWQAHHQRVAGESLAELDTTYDNASNITNAIDQGCDSQVPAVNVINDVNDLPEGLGSEPDLIDNHAEATDLLQAGDLVEHNFLGGPMLSIFIRNLNSRKGLFYTERGSWLIIPTHRPLFSVPRFVEPSGLVPLLPYAQCGDGIDLYLRGVEPSLRDVPRELGSHALNRMQRFRRLSLEVYRQHSKVLDDILTLLLSPSNPDDIQQCTLQEIASRVYGRPVENDASISSVMLWTVHRVMCKTKNVVFHPFTHRKQPVFTAYGQNLVEGTEKVREWIRIMSSEGFRSASDSLDFLEKSSMSKAKPIDSMASFLRTAKMLVLRSRENRKVAPTGFVGPLTTSSQPNTADPASSPGDTKDHYWSKDEKAILHYLDGWINAQCIKNDLASALGPLILRSTGLYEGRVLDCNTGFTFLQELGCVAPWQDRRLLDASLGAPESSTATTLSRLDQAASKSLEHWQAVDSMASNRRDWGDLPVYCIDGVETKERDDGISVEQRDGQTWIHIHVANPSAFMAPTSSISNFAAKLGQSVYLPTKKHAMMPVGLSEDHFSLDEDRPALTFSACLDGNGRIISRSITHGTLRNVHFVTPEKLDSILDSSGKASRESAKALLTVGGSMPSRAERFSGPIDNTTRKALCETDVINLKKLHDISIMLEKRRRRDGAIDFQQSYDSESSVFGRTFADVYFPDTPGRNALFLDHPILHKQDPIISIMSETTSQSKAQSMVGALMVLAGEIGSSWCQERGIPIPYRGMRKVPAPPFSPDQFKARVLDRQTSGSQAADINDVKAYMISLGQSDLSSKPLSHAALGLASYTRATSPLRRFTDLLVHWQIDGSLRSGQDAASTNANSGMLPFTQAEMSKHCVHLAARSLQIRYIENRANTMWSLQALFRAFYFGQASLPESFKVYIDRNDATSLLAYGRILGWGLRACLSKLSPLEAKHGDLMPGDTWNAQIQDINLYEARIVLQPVDLVSRKALNA